MSAGHERGRQTRAARIEAYGEQNRACAEIILRTPERYGGEGSLMMTWATIVIYENDAPMRADWRLIA